MEMNEKNIERTIPVFCAWCKKHSTQWNPPAKSPMGDYRKASHGMCPECYVDFKKKYNSTKRVSESKEDFMSFEEYLMRELRSILF